MTAIGAALSNRLDAPGVPAGASYLRVVVTARCTLACSYCHLEGDPLSPGFRAGVSTPDLLAMLHVALRLGVRKLKFLGGEPLLRDDLPSIIANLRQQPLAGDDPLDLSIITAGAAPPERLRACFDAGLTRANLSVHGVSPQGFVQRGGNDRKRAWRDENLAYLLAQPSPTKLNFVYTGPTDEGELAALLDLAAGWSAAPAVSRMLEAPALVVNVLNDLSQPTLDHRRLREVVERLRGPAQAAWIEPDPHSLATVRLGWADGLVVELKHQELGELGPWSRCATCPARRRCREGIDAIRLTHTGEIRTCMDRPDVVLPALRILQAGGAHHLERAWRAFATRERRR